MLVGATARDLLLHHVYGHSETRFTFDVDYAILVDSWEQFESVKQRLLEIPGFADKGKAKPRLYYRPDLSTPESIVDIIPFGKLEADDGTIAWPPDAGIVMNMAAFQDVFESSVTVEIEPQLVVKAPSIAGLIILKLFAWMDRLSEKDVQDIRRLLETYTDSGNVDRLYEEVPAELERLKYDTTLAGAFLLGKDARWVIDSHVGEKLSAVLSGKLIERLVSDMARTMSAIDDRSEAAAELLKEFFCGLGLDKIL
ncbi:MAG: nucleotidyl transferase AbiEii/AbiGii toxin family protein [Silvibacterium sp.]